MKNYNKIKLQLLKDSEFKKAYDNLEPDLVVNMTPVGLSDDLLPFPNKIESIIEKSKVCIDLIYNKETPFIKMAKEKGKITRNGKDLLKAQAAIAFQHFTNFKFSLNEINDAIDKIDF